MTRLRETGWAIALWGLIVVILGISSSDQAGSMCVAPAVCDPTTVLAIASVALVVAWLFGALLLLATHPRGVLRAFLVQVMVNMLALMAALVILSLVQLPTTAPDGTRVSVPLLSIPEDLLPTAVLFAVANALLRPVLFAVFGRLILRTVGLAVILVNALLFWAVALLSEHLAQPWIVPDPQLVWLFIDSLVVTAAVTVFNAFLGLDRPR